MAESDKARVREDTYRYFGTIVEYNMRTPKYSRTLKISLRQF